MLSGGKLIIKWLVFSLILPVGVRGVFVIFIIRYAILREEYISMMQ
jgi:hypothetical protein